MSGAVHTPGPWGVRTTPRGYGNLHWREIADESGVIAEVYSNSADGDSGEPTEAEAEANAHLIAAAPELLEALELLRSFGCPHCNGDCGSANPPVTSCPMTIASAAIARARGAQ